MGTPHSESVEKYRSGELTIRPMDPAFETSVEENKADHYAVLAQVINAGVRSYVENDELKAKLLEAPSVIRMAPIMAESVNQSVVDELVDPAHHERFLNLEASQYERYLAGHSRFADTSEAIQAGVRNFTNLFQDMFFSLGRFGLERATHKDNWRIAESLAHLNMQQMAAYRDVYMSNYRNWSQLVDHLQRLPSGGLAFRDGYPENAPIVIEFKDENNRPDPTTSL